MSRPPRIAIPVPHSSDSAYAGRALPQYERAIEMAGGEPVRIPLDPGSADVSGLIAGCDGVLLPGSKADVDPSRFRAVRSPHTAASDPPREAVDQLLLQDAYEWCKPVLGICYGLQSLNVFRQGTLVQHIPEFLPEAARSKVNHEAGKTVAVAHNVEINPDCDLAQIVGTELRSERSAGPGLIVPVNSSHHQSADTVGDGLRVVARCPDDGIIEAIEGVADDQFVLAVQWHPERSVQQDPASRAIFQAFMQAAQRR